MRLIQSV
jgi:hypothetical protein